LATQISDTRERIVATATRMFHARSFDAVGVAELCSEAGINKGSFYHFFSSKSELVLAVIDSRWEGAEPIFRTVLVEDTATPPLQRIEGFFAGMRAHTEQMIDEFGRFPGCPFGNLTAELSTRDDVIRKRLVEVYDAWTEIFCSPIKEAVARGELAAETDVRVTARGIVATLQGLAVLTKAYNDPKIVEELGRHMLAQMWTAAPTSP
jgi:TetR/AcrR family transcriptional repressor of nem operon